MLTVTVSQPMMRYANGIDVQRALVVCCFGIALDLLLLLLAAPPNTDAYAIIEVTQDCINIQGAGSVTSRKLSL